MKKVLLISIVCSGLISLQGHARAQNSSGVIIVDRQAPSSRTRPTPEAQPSPRFRCDGRTHCSQMTSCEEATFFLRNCPNVKMDGNHDGIPCERQWCRPTLKGSIDRENCRD